MSSHRVRRSSDGDSLDLNESLGVHERLHFDHGHGAVVATHVLAMHYAERCEIREVGGPVSRVDHHAADILRSAARGAHDFQHAAQPALPLGDEVADRDDLTCDEEDSAALLGKHAVIPAAWPAAKCSGIDDLKGHRFTPA